MEVLLSAMMLLICVDVLAYRYGVDSRESAHERIQSLPPRPAGTAYDESLAREMTVNRLRHSNRSQDLSHSMG